MYNVLMITPSEMGPDPRTQATKQDTVLYFNDGTVNTAGREARYARSERALGKLTNPATAPDVEIIAGLGQRPVESVAAALDATIQLHRNALNQYAPQLPEDATYPVDPYSMQRYPNLPRVIESPQK